MVHRQEAQTLAKKAVREEAHVQNGFAELFARLFRYICSIQERRTNLHPSELRGISEFLPEGLGAQKELCDDHRVVRCNRILEEGFDHESFKKCWIRLERKNPSWEAMARGMTSLKLQRCIRFMESDVRVFTRDILKTGGYGRSSRPPEERRHALAKSWPFGQIQSYIDYKAKWAGVSVEYVSASYTSKICHACGTINRNLKLTDRSWLCPQCGAKLDRDLNAAINIERRGRIRCLGEVRPGARGTDEAMKGNETAVGALIPQAETPKSSLQRRL